MLWYVSRGLVPVKPVGGEGVQLATRCKKSSYVPRTGKTRKRRKATKPPNVVYFVVVAVFVLRIKLVLRGGARGRVAPARSGYPTSAFGGGWFAGYHANITRPPDCAHAGSIEALGAAVAEWIAAFCSPPSVARGARVYARWRLGVTGCVVHLCASPVPAGTILMARKAAAVARSAYTLQRHCTADLPSK